MGNDGGSIPTRRELVKSAARLPTVSELKATALEALTHAWQTDPVSSDRLDLENAVSDWRGRLYNYETVLRGLMPGGGASGGGAEADGGGGPAAPEASEETAAEVDALGADLTFAATGIRSLRDVVRLHGTPSQKKGSSASAAAAAAAAAWQCPVTLKELGPGGKAVYLVPCGHVFSEAAVETILPDKLCPECSTGFDATNVVPILSADPAEVAKLRQRRDALRAEGLTHSLKKDKSAGHGHGHGHGDDKKSRKKKRKAGGDDAVPPKKKEKTDGDLASADKSGIASRINNPMTAALTAKVLAEQEAVHRRRKETATVSASIRG